uniref:Uncharacterized protein n=1 Tax=Anguilla anguilla TaxID=7936 RepID=A0A0E9WPP9_ANGAN
MTASRAASSSPTLRAHQPLLAATPAKPRVQMKRRLPAHPQALRSQGQTEFLWLPSK